MRQAKDRLTKHDQATIEAAAMGIGVMFALALAAFVAAVMFYLQTYHP
jgi:hypothetical protein